ncbi:MAG TPA: zf-HC2 domain-containing protein [Gemmatimonadaceae bacterium]|jgi:hypothetical protein
MSDRATTCELEGTEERAIRYASGQLDAKSGAAFEEHLVTCSACQEFVRFAVALRRTEVFRAAAPRRNTSRRLGSAIAAAVLVAVAAGLFIVAVPLRTSRVRALGTLASAPVYDGLIVRAAPAPSDSAFAAAMRDYAAGRYSTATTELDTLIARGTAGVPAFFFHGASALMLNRAAIGRDDFTRVVDGGPSPYAAEAHYYRALAELRLNDAGAAAADLRDISSDAAIYSRAHDLLDRVEALRSR